MIRICSICKTEKSLQEFEKNPNKPHGHGYRCHECNRKRRNAPVITVYQDCEECGARFGVKHNNHRYCSVICANRSRKRSSSHRFFTNMINPQRRADGLTPQDLKDLWEEQEGLCALSGVPMTREVGNGGAQTNVTIDRINAGDSYGKDNIQLVCKAVNSFRNNMTVSEFQWWCEQVTKATGGRKSKPNTRKR